MKIAKSRILCTELSSTGDNQMSHDYLGLEDTLDDDDYGFILDKEGNLKGIWVPRGAEDKDVPDAIVDLLKDKWGIDVNDESNYGYLH